MATEEEERAARRKEFAEAFAEGLNLYESQRAEREAKLKAAEEERAKAEGNAGGNGNGKRSGGIADWLLGGSTGR